MQHRGRVSTIVQVTPALQVVSGTSAEVGLGGLGFRASRARRFEGFLRLRFRFLSV